MGWFDEQIKERKTKDEIAFSDSLNRVVSAVEGRRFVSYQSDDSSTMDAVDDILKFYHIKKKEDSENLTDLDNELDKYLSPYGIMRRSIRLEGDWYSTGVGPYITTRNDNGHAVALIPRGRSSFCFFDENAGKSVKITKSNANLFNEDAYVFYKPFPLRELGFKDIIQYIATCLQPTDYILVALVTLIVVLTGMLAPALTKLLFSTVVVSKDTGLLLSIAIALVGASVGGLLFGIVKQILINKIETKTSSAVSAATMMRMLSLPASFFKTYSSGELTTYVNQMEGLCQIIVSCFLTTGLTSVFSLVYITQIFHYARPLAVPAFCVIIMTIVVSVITTWIQVGVLKKQMKLSARESGISYEMITGVQKIKLSGAAKRAFSKWADIYSEVAKVQYNPPLLIKINGVLVTAITLIGTIVIYYIADKNRISVANYTAFNASYGMVSAAFVELSSIALTFSQIRSILEIEKPILETCPEVEEGRVVVDKISGAVELSNVSFRYEEDEPLIINNLSLKIRAGQYVAIVGKTGCGKSTLVRLLLGFEKPEKGAVYYDGRDLQTLELKSLRKNMGVVIQNGKLFSGDIYHNIIISNPMLTLDEAWEAAEMAGCAEDIRNMPMGMHTYLSEGGGGISGGQRQRLMIARAVAPKPKILIFDEATSALDNITQKKVSDSLDNLKCTRIVIAHRLSTIKNCDRIVVLDGGNIIEDGTYDELIADNGFFAELVERQRVDV